jgi:CRP/FNR family cyclic AMP-dependent transcriptional regulator
MAELGSSFLAALAPDDEEALRDVAVARRFRRGDTLLHEHEEPGRVLVILRGRVKASHFHADGREIILGFRGAGDLIGELAALDGRPRAATVQATEPVEALSLPGSGFVDLLTARPGVALTFMRYLVGRLRAAEALRVDQATRNVVGRVAGRLSELCEGQATAGGAPPVLGLGQEDLAAWVGASREATSRALQLLRTLDVVETGRRRIVVLDPAALRRYAR